MLAISLPSLAQETADYKIFHLLWTFINNQNGQPTSIENAVAGKYYLTTSFNFTGESKYEFKLDEFAADGTQLTQVRENGLYSPHITQFTLQPQKK